MPEDSLNDGHARSGLPPVELSRLRGMARFCCDLGEPGDGSVPECALALFAMGSKLKKTSLPLAGTTELFEPTTPLRVLVFAVDASVAPDGLDDPWQLACVDRAALFAVADRYEYHGHLQVTLVEMERDELSARGLRVLDLAASDHVHGLFRDSFGLEAPPYATRTSFREIMGNRGGSRPMERLVPCSPHDLEDVSIEGPTTARRLDEHREECGLSELSSWETLYSDLDCLYHCRAARHRDDGAPALAFHEAQANFDLLYRSELDSRAVQRLYSGTLDGMGPMQRDLIADQVWFGSLFLQDFEPVSSDKIDEYLDDMREAYEGARASGANSFLLPVAFERIESWFRRRAIGDVDTCAAEIEMARSRIASPFRYEFSASFDTDDAVAHVNLFLPQKGVFPLAATNFALVGNAYESRLLSEEEFEERYSRLACRMGVLTLRLVKSKAPWLRRLELNAWYRKPGLEERGAPGRGPRSPECLYSISVGEEELVRGSAELSRDPFEVLRSLGARLHRTWDRGLVPVTPVFALEDGLEWRFGFEDFRRGWTLPQRCRSLSEGADAADLPYLMARMDELAGRGDLAGALDLGEDAEERFSAAWLDSLPPGTRALSCDSLFEEKHAEEMLADDGDGRAPHVLPRGLARLETSVARLCYEAGDVAGAKERFERARELDPASPGPCFGLFDIALDHGEEERARELADRAFALSSLSRDLARCYRCWGALSSNAGDYDLASALFTYALSISRDDGTVEHCMRELSYLRRRLHRDASVDADPVSELVVEGFPLHADPGLAELAAPSVERALLGGPLPDRSALAAYINGRDFPDGLGEALTNLLLCVMGEDFGSVGCNRYLYQPVILDEIDPIELLGDDAELIGPDDDEDGLGLLAVPYLDGSSELVFDVVATVDLQTREPVHVVRAGERVTVSASRLEGSHFLLARTRDYPGLELEERASLLYEFYPVPPGRARTRKIRSIDQLRSFATPDDVLAVLVGGGLTPEGVWVRLDGIGNNRRLEGTLMNEPHDGFGVHAGDACRLSVVADSRVPGGVVAVVDIGRR